MSNFSERFDKVKDQVKKGVDNVCEIVSEKMDIISLNSELKAAKNKLTSLYADYGKSCYDGCADEGLKAEIVCQVAIVKELEDVLATLEKSEPAQVFCTKCGASSDVEDDYCSKCGTKLKK